MPLGWREGSVEPVLIPFLHLSLYLSGGRERTGSVDQALSCHLYGPACRYPVFCFHFLRHIGGELGSEASGKAHSRKVILVQRGGAAIYGKERKQREACLRPWLLLTPEQGVDRDF